MIPGIIHVLQATFLEMIHGALIWVSKVRFVVAFICWNTLKHASYPAAYKKVCILTFQIIFILIYPCVNIQKFDFCVAFVQQKVLFVFAQNSCPSHFYNDLLPFKWCTSRLQLQSVNSLRLWEGKKKFSTLRLHI